MWGQPYIDCRSLALAIEQDLEARYSGPTSEPGSWSGTAAVAIRSYWGSRRFNKWLATQPRRTSTFGAILDEDLRRNGVPRAIPRRLVDTIDLDPAAGGSSTCLAVQFMARSRSTLPDRSRP